MGEWWGVMVVGKNNELSPTVSQGTRKKDSDSSLQLHVFY